MTDHQPTTTEPGTIRSVTPSAALSAPLNQNPANSSLARLNEGSRLPMRTALNTLGALLGVGEVLDSNGHDVRCLVVLWGDLRAEDTGAIRAKLVARYAPCTQRSQAAWSDQR